MAHRDEERLTLQHEQVAVLDADDRRGAGDVAHQGDLAEVGAGPEHGNRLTVLVHPVPTRVHGEEAVAVVPLHDEDVARDRRLPRARQRQPLQLRRGKGREQVQAA